MNLFPGMSESQEHLDVRVFDIVHDCQFNVTPENWPNDIK